jgi:uncharacterized membrane-anchored protein
MILLAVFFAAATVYAQQNTEVESVFKSVKWQIGPCVSELGDKAEMRVPEGYIFADGNDTRRLLEVMHNIPSGIELGFLAPKTLEWFLIFEFQESGYIKDDEKNSLDADAILKSLREGTEKANEEKTKRGWDTMSIVGWQQPPRYNPATNNLEWAVIATAKANTETVVNWNTRLLGRSGVMSVKLVSEPDSLTKILPTYTDLLNTNFAYKTGNRYADFRQGDKVAQYGLSALVLGGAAAVAAKSGFFKVIWKALIFVFLAAAGFLKKIFGRKNKELPQPQNETNE